jgi:hypothetical protein
VVDIVHYEATALPMSFDRLSMTWESVFVFGLLVDKLPLTASLVNSDAFVCPYEYLIPVWIINYIPHCGCFAIFVLLARRFCQWGVLLQLFDLGCLVVL